MQQDSEVSPSILRKEKLHTSLPADLTWSDDLLRSESVDRVEVYLTSRLAAGRSMDLSRPATQADKTPMDRPPIARNHVGDDIPVGCLEALGASTDQIFDEIPAGFSEDLDFRSTNSLGLKLIHNLGRQLRGSVKRIESARGTRYRISFCDFNTRQESPGQA